MRQTRNMCVCVNLDHLSEKLPEVHPTDQLLVNLEHLLIQTILDSSQDKKNSMCPS